jgi:penicillin-binding protein 1C
MELDSVMTQVAQSWHAQIAAARSPQYARRLLAAVLLGLFLGSASPVLAAIPSFNQVKADYISSETEILDRHGEVLERVRTNPDVRRGDWVALADISPALRHALVLSEDKRFFEHGGVDWRALSSAAWANLWNKRTRGASTLTMQLAGLLDPDLRTGSERRSVGQKVDQIVAAERFESGWRKDQILEAYLNLVPCRGELVGIDALSRTLFGKAPHGLTDSEAAIAAVLVRSPNAPARQVARRACPLLKTLRGADAPVNCVMLDMQTQVALSRRVFPAASGIAPHYARRLLAALPPGQSAPAQIRTTLDAPLQRVAVAALTQQIRELQGRHISDGAIVVLDNATGDVLAWVGSSGELSRAGQVDSVTALRQPGSTLKAFLYGEAIAEHRLTAASLLHDSPAQLQPATGLYIPQNDDRHFTGWVSARTALASSLNVPAVRTIVMVSPLAFQRQLGRFGIRLPENGDYYGYSLALGSGEVTLLALTNAYRARANGGRYGAVGEPPQTQALDPGAAFIIGNILSDGNARARAFGTDSILATPFWSAVKTGTSKDMRDNWVVGWSERYTVGVWVGNADGAPMWEVSGIAGAAPIWAALMRYLHQSEPSRPPTPPAGLIHTAIQFGPGLEAAREEWFLPGTEQHLFALSTDPTHAATAEAPEPGADPGRVAARITAPSRGTIIALDPDIPPENQRLILASAAGTAPPDRLRWTIDGHEIGRGASTRWLPWPGRHLIELRDAHGTLQDERRVEVRGATVKRATPVAATERTNSD